MNKNPIESIQEIKALMERSSKFLSLSGWSGIWLGICGIAASCIAYFLLDLQIDYRSLHTTQSLYSLVLLGSITLLTALTGAVYFTAKKTKKEGVHFISHVSKRLVHLFFVPLAAGGFLSLIFIYHHFYVFVAPTTLLFYGVALFTIYRDTISEVKFLAYLEIILGLLAFVFLGNGLLFWFIGFGLLHLFYGIFMWYKYDKKAL